MIELRDINKSFGEKRVIRNLTARLPDTGTILIEGASGTGKTTLLKILSGLMRADSGTVSGLEGRRIGFVFQEDRLLPWYTAEENVRLVSDSFAAKQSLCMLGLSDAMELYPKELSGGMKRRVAIARALSYTGDVLFLDEPFTGLDAENRARAAEAINARGKSLFLVTHEASDLSLFKIAETLRL